MKATRRANGDGSIYLRADGRWGVTVTLPDGSRRTVYAQTRSAARARLKDLTRRREEGLLSAGAQQKLSAYLEGWLEDVARASIRPRTYDAYRVNMQRLLPYLGHIRLGELGPAQIQAAYGELVKKGLSAQSVIHSHRVLHHALKQAVLWNLIPRNPTEATSRPRMVRI